MNNIDQNDKLAALDWAIRLSEKACVAGTSEPLSRFYTDTLRSMRDNQIKQNRGEAVIDT